MALPKSELFVAPGLRLEWQEDGGSWRVIAWRPHLSQGFSDRSELLRFVRWPASTPTGQLIRGWLDAQIAKHHGEAIAPVADPDADAQDPTSETRLII